MKTEKNILTAFILNLLFALFEFIGGIFTGSVAIISDAIHDIGDAASIGISYFLEKKSQKQPNESYTFGYARYSVMGSVITTAILLFGSVAVIYNAVIRFFNPTEINYDGMIIFAVIGVLVNLAATLLTNHGDSLNQKAVKLHMLEDTLGWIVVLIGAVIMRFTDLYIIDPLLSVCVSLFILTNALKNLKEALNVFLEKTPNNIDLKELSEHLHHIDGVSDVHHIHTWSMDGIKNYATMHVVAKNCSKEIKNKIRDELKEHGICHVTIELETEDERCKEKHCHVEPSSHTSHHHGHKH